MCEELNYGKVKQEFKYENLFNGTVTEQLKIAKIFEENSKMLEKIKKGWKWDRYGYDPHIYGTMWLILVVMSAVIVQSWKYIIIIIIS